MTNSMTARCPVAAKKKSESLQLHELIQLIQTRPVCHLSMYHHKPET